MKSMILILGLFLMLSPVFAENNGLPKSDRFNAVYDEVNDTTTLVDKETWGESIPGTGDAFSGHSLYFTVQIKFQGKVYDPADSGTTVNISFIEFHNDQGLKNPLYQPGDTVAFLADKTRYKFPQTNYSTSIGGDDLIGKHGLEFLTVQTDLQALTDIVNAKKVMGSITAQNPQSSLTFTFQDEDYALVEKALHFLDEFKKKA